MPKVAQLTGYPVFIQDWEESEQGWGIRPDGCSLHLSLEDQKTFCDAMLKAQHELLGPRVPKEYSRLCGSPRKILVTESLFEQIKTGESGIRFYQHEMPTVKDRILLP